MSKPHSVNCPICGTPVRWSPESRWRPFCSERCKLLDLGQWASESYRVPSNDSADAEDRPSDPDAT